MLLAQYIGRSDFGCGEHSAARRQCFASPENHANGEGWRYLREIPAEPKLSAKLCASSSCTAMRWRHTTSLCLEMLQSPVDKIDGVRNIIQTCAKQICRSAASRCSLHSFLQLVIGCTSHPKAWTTTVIRRCRDKKCASTPELQLGRRGRNLQTTRLRPLVSSVLRTTDMKLNRQVERPTAHGSCVSMPTPMVHARSVRPLKCFKRGCDCPEMLRSHLDLSINTSRAIALCARQRVRSMGSVAFCSQLRNQAVSRLARDNPLERRSA